MKDNETEPIIVTKIEEVEEKIRVVLEETDDILHTRRIEKKHGL